MTNEVIRDAEDVFDVASLRDPERLAAVRRTAMLDAAADRAFDRLARVATRALGVPVSLVSLVGADRQRFRACYGLDLTETPLSHSFCKHVVVDDQPLVVTDAREDPRVRGNLAIDELGVIAYAGFPIRTSDGHVLGSFCAIDTRPRVWSDEDLALVEDLAEAAVEVIELRAASLLGELEARRAADLAGLGRRLQRALMPRVPALTRADAHAVYQPGERRLLVGGDFHHVAERPGGAISVLVGDVAGHGAEAAAFAAGLRAGWGTLLHSDLDDAERMRRLNAVALEEQPEEGTFATAIACVIDPDAGTLRITSAGHPAPLLIGPGGASPVPVRPGPPLGVAEGASWDAVEHPLPPDAVVLVHTDGLIEGRDAPGSAGRFGPERLAQAAGRQRQAGLTGAALLESLVDLVVHANGGPLADDLAAVLVEPHG